MSERDEILGFLKTLQERDFPISVTDVLVVLYPVHAPTGSGIYHTNLSLGFFDQCSLKGFVEREIEKRGLWSVFIRRLPQRFRRYTLLEALKAAAEVTA
jgi:hypothetical protein